MTVLFPIFWFSRPGWFGQRYYVLCEKFTYSGVVPYPVKIWKRVSKRQLEHLRNER